MGSWVQVSGPPYASGQLWGESLRRGAGVEHPHRPPRLGTMRGSGWEWLAVPQTCEKAEVVAWYYWPALVAQAVVVVGLVRPVVEDRPARLLLAWMAGTKCARTALVPSHKLTLSARVWPSEAPPLVLTETQVGR